MSAPLRSTKSTHVLSERLGFLRAEPPKRRYGRVFVGSIEEAQGRSFDVVFLPGWQKGCSQGGLWKIHFCWMSTVGSLRPGWIGRIRGSLGERMLLRSATAVAAKALVVSYPRIALQPRE